MKEHKIDLLLQNANPGSWRESNVHTIHNRITVKECRIALCVNTVNCESFATPRNVPAFSLQARYLKGFDDGIS